MKAVTTAFAVIDDDRLTGEESYPIVGDAVPGEVVAKIMKAC